MKHQNFIWLRAGLVAIIAIAALAIAACSNPINSTGQTNSGSRALANNFRIVGYSASWRGTAAEIDFSKLTHVIYAFAIPDANGNIISLENTAKLQSIISLGHAQGVKVSLAVGGWSYNGAELDGTFENLAANAGARSNLVNNLMNLVSQYNLDGIDVDWEYPDAGTSSADHYTSLMGELSTALKARGKLLSAAVTASGWAGNAVSTDVMNKVDFLNIMAYDGDAGAGHSPMSYATSALDFWITQRGLPAAKANLGVPFYARPSWKAYDELVPLAPSVVPYTDYYNGDYYNGIPTIKAKTSLAMQRAGGIMIWELSHDTTDSTSLLSAIYATAGGSTNNTAPEGYTWCANEGGSYTLSGLSDVAYGANGSFIYHYDQTGTITFNNANFGDPITGVVKAGYYKAKAVTPVGPSGYTWCANENGSFTLNGTCDVAYGANGSFAYHYGQTGTVTFNNANFGDPIYGVAKAGFYKASTITPTPPPSGTWTANSAYKVGDIVTYNGLSYSCIQAHTSLTGWEPPNVPALWRAL